MYSTAVPADGGWPLGLSDEVVREYAVTGGVDQFERRKQMELRQRYVEVYERRRARFERKMRDAEEDNNGGGKKHGGRSKSGSKDSGGGGGNVGRKRSGSDPGPSTAASAAAASIVSTATGHNKDAPSPSPSPRKRSHSFAVGGSGLADVPIRPPPQDAVLETRPFDYKSSAKVLAHHAAARRASVNGVRGDDGDDDGAIGGGDNNDATHNNDAEDTAAILNELDDGKNPLFATRDEEERIHLLLRDAKAEREFEQHPTQLPSPPGGSPETKTDDDNGGASASVPSPPASPSRRSRPRSNSTTDPYHYQPPSPSRKQHGASSSSSSNASTRRSTRSADPHYRPNDVYTHADVMHVRSELEKLRADRSRDLGCTCRKLHVVLPGQTAGRKHKHRRLTERRVKEELRKRGLMHGANVGKNREELEALLHDTVEQEGCCSNDSCPCVHNGIGCQADTCSCWEPGHDVVDDKKKASASEHETTVEELWAHPDQMRNRCGNRYGLYVVDFATIGRHRRALIAASKGDPLGGKAAVPLCLPLLESDDGGL